MNFKDAKTLREYVEQKLQPEFSDYLTISSKAVLEPEKIEAYMQILAESMGKFISREGYRPSGKSKIIIKIPFGGTTADPLNPHGTLAGKTGCELTATKDQYIFYASEIIDELKKECQRQIEKTWKERLIEHLTALFDEKYPWIDEDDRELENRFLEKRGKLIVKIEKMVEGFEIP